MEVISTQTKIKVLDLGHLEYVNHMGSDLTVVNAARVSFNQESEWDIDQEAKERLTATESSFRESDLQVLSQKDKKLITYLAKHQHWTPFAHPQITLRIKAPIFVRTQLFKHKVGMVENEVSRRYIKSNPEFYVPKWRYGPTGNAKQGSSDFIDSTATDYVERLYIESALNCVNSYNKLLEQGVAPEQARSILPQGTYTEWWWTGSLSAYARIYKQRIDSHAQWEVQQYALAINVVMKDLFPISWKVLTEYEKI